jgi:uncharacterized protein
MTAGDVLLLVAAGFVGGMANAMAGGASLVTFPALMAVGLSPIVANASNAVAVVFGNLVGAWADRKQLPRRDGPLLSLLPAAAIGGALGGVLLLYTPETIFVLIVPLLIGVATVIFGFSKRIQTAIAGRAIRSGSAIRGGLVWASAVYGGYFGAGLGVIFLAVLSATSTWELRATNAVKNVLGVVSNVAAITVFVVQDVISWPETLVMIVACIAGGFAGTKALAVIAPATMRRAIVVIGVAMTAYYAWRYWL